MTAVHDLLLQLLALLVKYQGELVTLLSSLLVSIIAKRFPAFAGLGDVAKRVVLFVSAVVVSLAIALLGGTPGIDLGAIVAGGTAASIAAGGVFKIARTTPTTQEAAEVRRENL